MTRFWTELTWRDFAARDMSRVVAVLPVAAVEQHGPHLPVGVDMYINQGYVAAAAKALPDDLQVLFLPVQAIGKSNEHIEYPGTLTFSLETVTRAWIEIGDSVARAGCRRLVFINSHGGNVPVIDAAIRELRVRHRMLAVHAAWHRLAVRDNMFSARERAHGIHGGEAETSLMLALQPHTVKMDQAQDFKSAAADFEREFTHLRALQPNGMGWMASDLNPAGAVGDAASGEAMKGDALLASGVEAFIALMRDVAAFDLARLRAGPLGG